MQLNQIAISVVDLRLTEQWFREGLGFMPAGGKRTTGRTASTRWWLVARNPCLQLELIEFARPVAKLMPDDARPCDIGWRRLGVWVADFDATLDALAALGTRPFGLMTGDAGARRACVRSPDGVFVELMEDDPLPQPPGREREACAVAVRSVTLSTLEHESLWGLGGAETRSTRFECGDVHVEAVQYLDPTRRQQLPDDRIAEQSIVDIGFDAHSRGERGFVPMPQHGRPSADNQRVQASVDIAAPLADVWAVLNDQDRMGEWMGLDRVSVRRAGFTQRHGRGSERLMQGLPGAVLEQVVEVEPMSRIRYRVLEGSPCIYVHGEIGVAPQGMHTRVSWSIRLRSRVPLMGGLIRIVVQRVLADMLRNGLKAHVESVGRAAVSNRELSEPDMDPDHAPLHHRLPRNP